MALVRRVAGLVLTAAGVLVAEVAITVGHSYLGAADAVDQDASYGSPADPGLTLLILGDSTAAGVGAGSRLETVSGRLATVLAGQGHHVQVRAVAVSGARTADLAGQIGGLPAISGRTVALIQIGANDTTHLGSVGGVRSHLSDAVTRLTGMGAQVVVATCPDLGTALPFPQPLRLITAWRGRTIAHAEADVTRSSGGLVVPLAQLTGPAFRRDHSLLSRDRFHPSGAGYGVWAEAILPYVEEAVRA